MTQSTSPSSPPPPPRGASPPRPAWRIWTTTLLALVLGVVTAWVAWHRPPEPGAIPYFSIPIGNVRPPLPYRIVSFHQGRVDKNLIKLASQLGFNGVQVQLEGSNAAGIKDFASRDQREHIIDYCHSLGMKVTVWVHELSDLPLEEDPAYLGPITVDNAALWKVISDRYDWILRDLLPTVDGLALTVVETEFNATDEAIMHKLVTLIDRKCREHHKELIVRTFVWHPDELEGVMGAIQNLPDDIVIMSKVVPQDWQMRGGNAAEIGAVGNHPQIEEYDAAGEYFLSDSVANCMVDRLKQQFDYGTSKHVAGICVRVDRYDASVLWTPNEVNLWALGMLASGATNDPDEIWQRWANYRYGEKAAPAVIAALKPTPDVVAEMLSIGPFTFGDTRGTFVNKQPSYDVALPYDDVMGENEESNLNWQMWRWDGAYVPTRIQIDMGDAKFIEQLRKQEAQAAALADQCLADLEKARPLLPEKEFAILRTRLLTNKVQLAFRAAAKLAALHWRQALVAQTQTQINAAMAQYRNDLAAAQAVTDALAAYPKPRTLEYLGKKWPVDAPLLITQARINDWLEQAHLVTSGP